jgi:uncharacterized delta-60 repeat protein
MIFIPPTLAITILRNTASALITTLLLYAAMPVFAVAGQPGTIDTTFNGTGTLVFAMTNSTDEIQAIATQSDGKVVFAGRCSFQFCLTRHNKDGTLDLSFGNGGKVFTSLGGDARVGSVLIEGTGKIIVAGNCVTAGGRGFCVLRYNANGTLDTGFGAGSGTLTTPIDTPQYLASSAVLQPDGKIVQAGLCQSIYFCAVRYDADGTIDTSFAPGSDIGAGKVRTLMGTGGSGDLKIVLQADGKIVIAGSCTPSNSIPSFCVLRYNPNGALDQSFGVGSAIGAGKVATAVVGSGDYAGAVAVQADEKIVAAGRCDRPGTSFVDACILRYNADGTLDTGFARDSALGAGKVKLSLSGFNNYAAAVVMQPDGKILIAAPGGGTLNALRLHSDGTFDKSFNGGGIATAISGGYFGSSAISIALQPDGKLIVGGYSDDINRKRDFAAARFDGGPFGYQQCMMDIDGDGVPLTTTDTLIVTRAVLGMTGSAVTNGISFSGNAVRRNWSDIRKHLVTQCGINL